MTKAAHRVFLTKLVAAMDKSFYRDLKEQFKPDEVSVMLMDTGIVLDANILSATSLFASKGWKEDSNGSHYAVMTKGSKAIRLDEDDAEEHVTVTEADHPDPANVGAKVEASLFIEDPSDYLVDPDDDNYRHDDTRDTQIGDPKPSRMVNDLGLPPSVPVMGGGAGGTGYGGTQPSPDPDDEKITKRLQRLKERRQGGTENDMLTEPGSPVNFADSDGPIFMSDQPWGQNTNAPVSPAEMLNIKEIAPEAGTDEVVHDEDLPIGSTDGTIMANGITLMAKVMAKYKG